LFALPLSTGSKHTTEQSHPRDSDGEKRSIRRYKIKAKVSDLNAGIFFDLETKFRLQ